MKCLRPDSCYFPSSEVLRVGQGDVSVHDRGKKQLGPDVVPDRVSGYWI